MRGLGLGLLAVNYTVFLKGYAADVREDLMEKAAAFTAVADASKNHTSKLQSSGAFDVDKLVSEAVAQVAKGDSYTQTRFFGTIPVVAGWTAAQDAAKREGIDFKVVAFDARNKSNEPEKGSFREQMLRDLCDQVAKGGKETLGRINTATNTLHYMRAIALDATCMGCHGDPAKYDAKDDKGAFDGKDALGFRMEGWKPGDIHGAYEVQMPLAALDSQVAGFFKNGLLVSVPVAVLGLGAFIYLLRVMLVRPVRTVIGMIQDIATGEGDLTKRISVDRKDEIGQLGQWFNAFLDNMHKIISEVRSATTEVAGAATEIAASSEEMSRGLETQERQTTQVAAAVAEMSSSVSEVARQSGQAAAAAVDAGNAAKKGGEIVTQTVEQMNGIAKQVNQSAKAVGDLGAKGEEIGKIIGVINDIADQTNLLALNAAIEAARAGEHGRGFAVVADEVRKLAERTTQATKQVADTIRMIQDETMAAVKEMNGGTGRADESLKLAQQASGTLAEIVRAVRQTLGSIDTITRGASAQRELGESIRREAGTIVSSTDEVARGSGQSAQAVTGLLNKAAALRRTIEEFAAPSRA